MTVFGFLARLRNERVELRVCSRSAASGKIDRKALLTPDSTRLAENASVASRTEMETKAAIWQDVLGVDRVGVDGQPDSVRPRTMILDNLAQIAATYEPEQRGNAVGRPKLG